MKWVEIEMSKKFREYAVKNITTKIEAVKVVKELLKNESIHRPKKIKINELSIGDLKYKTSKIKELYINSVSGIFKIGY